MSKTRLGIMASGGGSNADAILQSCADGKLNATGAVIISNNKDAGVHNVAKKHNVPSYHISRDMFRDGRQFADKLINIFREHQVDLILLAGYMRKLPPALIRSWRNAVLNIHPALLPAHGGKGMYGIRVHEDVLAKGDKETGVTIHFVDEEYDRGPILHQVGGVPVYPNDTPEKIAARVLEVEHRAYCEAVQIWMDKHN
ncbi:MAG: phosphoribosylglycinamide formyltransferase [Candidatus Electryonea clarkiae]|nr:phosphoribosylglycinamide formyltransferase [Candidatus Electryonea clarkiae]MDP8287629.1 phosphoribosylglycinamide formyltransferase [Candidatus Electryonea clarkiae]